MGKTVCQNVAQAVQVVLEGGAVPPLLFRLGFESIHGRLERLDVLPEGAVLLLVLGGRLAQLPQLRLPYCERGLDQQRVTKGYKGLRERRRL